MSVYARFKKTPDGFRNLVQLLETTPKIRRQKMIDVGMKEDPDYTKKALRYVFSFEDIVALPDSELAEVIGEAPPLIVGLAIHEASEEVKSNFLRLAPPRAIPQIRETLDLPAPQQSKGAQAKMIEAARKLEKRGVVKTKRITS